VLYQNPSYSVAERVQDLLSRMTVQEKLAQMHALWLELSEDGEHKLRPDASNDFSGGDPEKVRQMFAHGLGQITRPLGARSHPLSHTAGHGKHMEPGPDRACRQCYWG